MIRVSREDDLRVVTLDNPPVNAMTPAGLGELLTAIDAEDDARAIVLDAANRCFSAGFDLRAIASDTDEQTMLGELLRGLGAMVAAMHASPVPIVAAVHGAALAGGCALLGGADVVVASADATLGYPAVLIGVSPAVSAPFLRGAVGDGGARRMLLDTKAIDAAEALRLGLVHEIAPDADGARARAREVARHMGAKPAHAIRATSAWITEIAGPTAEAMDAGVRASLACVGTDEARTRIQQAAERR